MKSLAGVWWANSQHFAEQTPINSEQMKKVPWIQVYQGQTLHITFHTMKKLKPLFDFKNKLYKTDDWEINTQNGS